MTAPAQIRDGSTRTSTDGVSPVSRRCDSAPWRNARVATAVACCLVVIAWSWMDHDIGSPNERSRLYLTEALVERGELAITDEVARHGRIFDLAERDGDYFCDKAPAAAFLATPAYAATRALNGEPLNISTAVNVGRYLVALPIAALALLLFLGLLSRLGIGEAPALLTLAAICCGSVYSHYSAALYGHALAAFFVLGTTWALAGSLDAETPKTRALWAALAAFSASTALATEYQCAVFCLALLAAVLSAPQLRNARTIIACAMAGAIPAALVLLYNDAAFGGPFETSYHHLAASASAELHAHGIAGVTVPRLRAIVGLLFSPARGLLATTPFFLLAIPGTFALWRRSRPLAIFITLGSSLLFLVVASTPVWMGGWSFGPRLLVPMYLITGVSSAFAANQWLEHRGRSVLAFGAAVGGVLVVQPVRLTAPEVPFSVANPLPDVALLMLREAMTSPNLLTLGTSLRGWVSLVPVGLACILALGVIVPDRPRRAEFKVAVCFVAALCVAWSMVPWPGGDAAGAAFVESLRGILPE